MRHLVVREHERVPVLESPMPGDQALSPGDAEALLRVCERAGLSALSAGHRSVRFGHYCGVIQAGGLVVEVLPKVSNDAGQDRVALLRMLSLAFKLPLGRLNAADLAMQRHSLLKVLLGWFCDELLAQFHRGLLRGYVVQEEALPTVRGRWRPAQDPLRHPGRVDRLSCEFDELTVNNAHHQVLKAALRRALPLAHGIEPLGRKLNELQFWLADVDDLPADVTLLERLPRSRLSQRYERALMMARWFLAGESPDLRRGRQEGIALLFNMNALFQATLGA